jgi:hypothetical protein
MVTEDSKKVLTAIGKVKDFTELTPANLKLFSQAVVAVNEFNKKMSRYGEKIFDKHYKSLKEWNEYLSEADFKRTGLDMKEHWTRYVRCFKTGAMIRYDARGGWSMGDSTGMEIKYEFSDNGKVLTVINSWKTKSARFNHIPWVPRERRFVITLSNGNVEVEGDHIDAQR